MDAKEATKQLIERASNLKEFVVEVRVPDRFRFNGTVPYDMHIKDNIASVQILAETPEEATSKVKEYFEGNQDV